MRENHVLTAWRAGEQTIGGWLGIDSSFTAEIMAQVGFDWLCLDMQHGMLDYNDVKRMLPAISTTKTIPIVRVPWNEPYEIMKALDAGAYGVIVPLVNNRAEAEQAVAACRYPPEGIRSFGPARASLYAGPGYLTEANAHMACIVMIETKEALDNLDEILSTPGVDAAYIGPADLAFALGLTPTGDNDHPVHVAAVTRIYEACPPGRSRDPYRITAVHPALSRSGLSDGHPGSGQCLYGAPCAQRTQSRPQPRSASIAEGTREILLAFH